MGAAWSFRKLVRLCRLDEMLSVAQLIQGVGQGTVSLPANAANNGTPRPATVRPPEATDGSKKNALTGNEGAPASGSESTLILSESTLADVWARLKSYLTGNSPILANHLKNARTQACAIRMSRAPRACHPECGP